MKITILGCGVFGGAMASHLVKLGYDIQKETIDDSEIIFVAVPSFAVVSVLTKVKNEIKNQPIIICSKGFADGEQLISEALEKEFSKEQLYFLYGPTLADELSRGEISGMVLAGGEFKGELKKKIESETLHMETSNDIIGVQIGAALKNAIEILVGIVEGKGYGQNTQAFIFTKGVEEIQKFGVALGAEPNTFLGLSCVGDLTLISRNRQLGIELGKGKKLDDIISEMKYTPEGITNLKNAKMVAEKHSIDIPIINLLHSVVFENFSIEEAIKRIK